MSKYTRLLQGLGNPQLSLRTYTEPGCCVWYSSDQSAEAGFLSAGVLSAIDTELTRLLAVDAASELVHAAHEGFGFSIRRIAAPNRAQLSALVLLEQLPVGSNIATSFYQRDADGVAALLDAIESLLMNELRVTAVGHLPLNSTAHNGTQISLLKTVNFRAQQYLANQSSMSSEKVLCDVLSDCLENLNLDRAILYLKDGNQLLTKPFVDHDSGSNAAMLRAMRSDVLLFTAESSGSILKPGEPSQDSFASLDRLVMPVTDSLGRAVGVLCFIQGRSIAGGFAVVDQQLIELLALPIAQIVNAKYDTATGLLNAEGFYPRLGELLQCPEIEDHESCLLYIRFGQLISIGDNCGSAALDEAVVQLGALLEKRIRKRDLAARTASSDFLLYLNKCSVEDAQALCEDLLDTLKGYRFSYKNKQFGINVYIGIVPLAHTERDVSSLLSAGEDACVEAMHKGSNDYRVYRPRQKVAERSNGLIVWSDRIRESLRDDKLHLYTQPVVSLRDLSTIDHHEILLRIKSEKSLLVAPSVFIRIAERSRLIEQVDHWVIRNAFDHLHRVYSEHKNSSVVLSINISGTTISDGFPAFIDELIKGMAFQSDAIIFEVTEASAVSNMKYLVKSVKQMRLNGFRFSLDDFGAGMGSFVFLQNLSVDRIKIDGTLIRGINRSEVNQSIVQAIQAVSKTMGLETTAKLVDDPALLETLKSIGVNYVQGHLVSKASPINQLLKSVGPESNISGG